MQRGKARLAPLFLTATTSSNQRHAHAFGDQVLKLVAHCLASSVRESDTVSRHGGDEFLILLTEVSQASDAVLIAEKVLAALGVPSRVGDHVLRLTASIGISIYPDDGEDAATLIDRADAAMYRAKRHTPGSFVFHGEQPTSERSVEPPALKSLQDPLTHYEVALTEHDRRHQQLREANEQLVLAALSAQQLQAAAEQAQRRQANSGPRGARAA
jgi:diguanylate cyclase (GGDEF)-like protein